MTLEAAEADLKRDQGLVRELEKEMERGEEREL